MSEPSVGGYAFVPATAIDEPRLLAFTAAVFPHPPAREPAAPHSWRGPAPALGVAAVHEASGAMAGLCGVRPIEWIIGGAPRPAFAMSDWYVDAAHAGHGIGKRLVQHFERPDHFVYAISLSDAAIANFKRIGWLGEYRASLMLLPLPQIARAFDALRGRAAGIDLQDYAVTGGTLPAELAAALDAIDLRTRA